MQSFCINASVQTTNSHGIQEEVKLKKAKQASVFVESFSSMVIKDVFDTKVAHIAVIADLWLMIIVHAVTSEDGRHYCQCRSFNAGKGLKEFQTIVF